MDAGILANAPAQLDRTLLAAGYRLLAESFLYPEERDPRSLAAHRETLAGATGATSATRLVDAFFASPRAEDPDEYLTLLELTPPCPLYLGYYLFEEPTSCRGAGLSGRNAYMLELKAIYRHFGLEMAGGELADFVPLVLEFLALSLERPELDGIGLRRRLLERHVKPALPEMRKAQAKYDTPYAQLTELFVLLVEEDVMGSPGPAWEPLPMGFELPVFPAGAADRAGGRDPGREREGPRP